MFISGDATAKSPAMLSFLHATENGKKASDIEIVSIGATKERPDKIPEDIGVIEWAFRITSLEGPVKQHTQDYLLNWMLEENGSSLHKFNLVIPMEQDDELSTLVTRSERLVELKNDFINENRLHVAKMLKPIL